MCPGVSELASLPDSLHTGSLSNDMLNCADGTAGKNKDNVDISENEDDEENSRERVHTEKGINLMKGLRAGIEQRNIFPIQQIMILYKMQDCLIREHAQHMNKSKLSKWFKQANRSSEQHSQVENPLTSIVATPAITTVVAVEIRDAITAQTPHATSAGTSDETSV
jgi:hypothetical protein